MRRLLVFAGLLFGCQSAFAENMAALEKKIADLNEAAKVAAVIGSATPCGYILDQAKVVAISEDKIAKMADDAQNSFQTILLVQARTVSRLDEITRSAQCAVYRANAHEYGLTQ